VTTSAPSSLSSQLVKSTNWSAEESPFGESGPKSATKATADGGKTETERSAYDFPHPYYFWESILVFPLLAVFCILLILCLSVIFFGRREGQQWRDYKTPKEQLHEYLNVRESQRHLRELSVQRQMLLMSSERSNSNTPLGIQSFLQPRNSRVGPLGGSQPKLAPSSPNRVRIERRANSSQPVNDSHDHFPLLTPRSSVGKQTVAEAALATGSSLNLYRNPLDTLDNEEVEENEEDIR